MIITGYFVCYAYLFAVIGGIGAIQKLAGFSVEISRKLVHTLIVFTWVFLYHYFWYSWQILIVPLSFIFINTASYRFKIFKMIERDDGRTNHKGTIYFSIGITVLMLSALLMPETIMATGIATFALCFGDGLAAIFGISSKKKVYIVNNKTVAGTISCFLGAVVGLYFFSLLLNYHMPFYSVFLLSIATAALELVGNGFDNFSILFGVYFLSTLFIRSGVF